MKEQADHFACNVQLSGLPRATTKGRICNYAAFLIKCKYWEDLGNNLTKCYGKRLPKRVNYEHNENSDSLIQLAEIGVG